MSEQKIEELTILIEQLRADVRASATFGEWDVVRGAAEYAKSKERELENLKSSLRLQMNTVRKQKAREAE